MLISDRDLKALIESGRVGLDPYDPALVQPSSVDVRLDRYFRVFENHRYPHIDPSEEQPELTRLVEPAGDEPFILHPGEFALASTYEIVTLPDDVAGRLEGKALDLDTPIPTRHGWKLLSEVDVGEAVFDETGTECRVTGIGPVLVGRPCYRVEFSDGSDIVADAEHLWWTATRADRRRHRSDGSLRTTREIAARVRVGNEWNHHVPIAGAVQYPTRALPVDPYVLGIWLGDGTTTQADVTVHPRDHEILDLIRAVGYPVTPTSSAMPWCVGGAPRVRDPRTGRYAANASLRSTSKQMRLLGDKHVPEIYFVADVDQRLALLQGLMDSDGDVDESGRCEFVSTLERLADAVVELAAGLGLRPKKRKERAMLNGVDCGPAYQVTFSSHIPVFRLQRKLDRQVDRVFHRHRAVTAVVPVPTRAVRCIEVSSPSGMYLAGLTYIPTHNSSLGRLGLLTHSTAGFIDPGFSGHITLELSNVATLPIKLWPGMKVGQLCLFQMSSAAEHPYGSAVYGSRYQGQRGPTPSRSWQNFSRTDTRRD